MVRLHKVVLTGCANVLAAMKLGEKKGPEAVIVTLMVDSGLKYLSTVVYNK
jgi:cysteine synthase A